MIEPTPTPPNRLTMLLVVATALLAVLILVLAWQNRSLKAQLTAAANAPPPGALKVGDTILPFDVVDDAGNKTPVAFDGSRETLLLVFSTSCGACQETIPVWNELLSDGAPKTLHVVGLETDFHPTNFTDQAIPIPDLRFPVFGAADPTAEPMSKFPAIPAAALLDGKGAVRSVWFGVPTDAAVAELRSALKSR